MAIVDSSSLLFERPLLRSDFRVNNKSLHAYQVDFISWERLVRSCTGFLVPYQRLEIYRIHPSARSSR